MVSVMCEINIFSYSSEKFERKVLFPDTWDRIRWWWINNEIARVGKIRFFQCKSMSAINEFPSYCFSNILIYSAYITEIDREREKDWESKVQEFDASKN